MTDVAVGSHSAFDAWLSDQARRSLRRVDRAPLAPNVWRVNQVFSPGAFTDRPLAGQTDTQLQHLWRIRKSIEAQLQNPKLSVGSVAAEAGISPRYVQALCKQIGSNFSTLVREMRLDHCAYDLQDPRNDSKSLAAISFSWGFSEAAHFSRCFKKKFGVSPKVFRARACAERACSGWGRGLPFGEAGGAGHTSRPPNSILKRSPPPGNVQRRSGPVSSVVRVNSDLPKTTRTRHHLRATSSTVHWGYFSRDIPSVHTINSGDVVVVDTLNHRASDDYERMIEGDQDAQDVFHWSADVKKVDRRGAGPMDASVYGRGAGEGFGVHICTGPIAVRGAEPGDVLEVRILDISFRASQNPRYAGRIFGCNSSSWWGYHNADAINPADRYDVVTLFEIDATNENQFARALYSYRWTPQVDPFGVLHRSNDYPGVVVDHRKVKHNPVYLKNVSIPLRPHFGVIAVAPAEGGIFDSLPPSYFGGNLDNWRLSRGARIFLPVSAEGALLSIGDPHAAFGDGGVGGTGISCHLTGEFEVIVHKPGQARNSALFQIAGPLIETETEWIIQGFSTPNHPRDFGSAEQGRVYKQVSLDRAMRDAFQKTKIFLTENHNLSEDEAVSLMSVAVDFGVTQVMDANWGIHAIVPKRIFG